MIVSHTVFMWWCSIMIGGLSGIWCIYDAILLRRHLQADDDRKDQIFGSVVGVAIGALGVIGVFALHANGIPEPTHCLPECADLYFWSP